MTYLLQYKVHVYAVVDKNKKTSRKKLREKNPANAVLDSQPRMTSADPTFNQETTLLPDIVPATPFEEEPLHNQSLRPDQYDNVVALQLQVTSDSYYAIIVLLLHGYKDSAWYMLKN